MKQPQSPNFLFTYWNPIDLKPSLGNAFQSYLKNVQLAEYTGKVVGSYLQQQSEEQRNFLNNIGAQIENLGYDISDGFNQINQQLTLIQVELFNTNLLLQDIKKILKQPDSEKQRIKHIELGMKFFNQALKDEDIINDAIEEFEAAIKLMKQDWFAAYQLGLCYTYYEKVQNFEKATALFLSAAKYAAVDTVTDETFNKQFFQNIAASSNNDNVCMAFSAECYLQVAFIQYVTNHFEEAVTYAQKAVTAHASAKNYFLLAKYQSRFGQYQQAIESLENANAKDADICKVFSNDLDIISNSLFTEDYFKQLLTKNAKKKQDEYSPLVLRLFDKRNVWFPHKIRESYFETHIHEYPYQVRKGIEEEVKQFGFRVDEILRDVGENTVSKIVLNSLIENNFLEQFVIDVKKSLYKYFEKEKISLGELGWRAESLKKEINEIEKLEALTLNELVAFSSYYNKIREYAAVVYKRQPYRIDLFKTCLAEAIKQNKFASLGYKGGSIGDFSAEHVNKILQTHLDYFIHQKDLKDFPDLSKKPSFWERLFG